MTEYKRNCPSCGKDVFYRNKYLLTQAIKRDSGCLICSYKKISESKTGNKNSSKRPEVKEKMRIARLKWITKNHGGPCFNPNACKFIDFINKKMNFNFQHALNNKEVWIAGFSVDGYDEKQNVVFEYDEPPHQKPKQKKHDEYKQQCIIDKIKPSMFFRYDEKSGKLNEVISKQEYFI
jgi:hypothetical protein